MHSNTDSFTMQQIAVAFINKVTWYLSAMHTREEIQLLQETK